MIGLAWAGKMRQKVNPSKETTISAVNPQLIQFNKRGEISFSSVILHSVRKSFEEFLVVACLGNPLQDGFGGDR